MASSQKLVKNKRSVTGDKDRSRRFNDSRFLIRILVGIVLVGSIAVVFGWIFDVTVLKSILPKFVAMKFITALSFFFSSILVLLLAKKGKGEISKLFIIIISSTLLLLMTIFLVSFFWGFTTGLENLFVQELPGAIHTIIPGLPAVPTLIGFLLISLSGLVFSFNPQKPWGIFFFGLLISLIGVVAIVGYLFDIPMLYYSFSGYTPIAVNASFLFILLGVSLILFGSEHK